jgi:hypothetical protein
MFLGWQFELTGQKVWMNKPFIMMASLSSETFPYGRHMKMDCTKNKRKQEMQEESKSIKKQNEELKDLVEFCCQQVKKLQHQLLKREVHQGWNVIKGIYW